MSKYVDVIIVHLYHLYSETSQHLNIVVHALLL